MLLILSVRVSYPCVSFQDKRILLQNAGVLLSQAQFGSIWVYDIMYHNVIEVCSTVDNLGSWSVESVETALSCEVDGKTWVSFPDTQGELQDTQQRAHDPEIWWNLGNLLWCSKGNKLGDMFFRHMKCQGMSSGSSLKPCPSCWNIVEKSWGADTATAASAAALFRPGGRGAAVDLPRDTAWWHDGIYI